jgi:hypothetical protein
MVKWKKLTKPDAKGWPFALVIALVLGVLVLLDGGSISSTAVTASCRVEVTAEVLSARSGADPSAQPQRELHRGDLLGAETEVQNGYRKLADGTWALNEYLRPVPGSQCT